MTEEEQRMQQKTDKGDEIGELQERDEDSDEEEYDSDDLAAKLQQGDEDALDLGDSRHDGTVDNQKQASRSGKVDGVHGQKRQRGGKKARERKLRLAEKVADRLTEQREYVLHRCAW